MMLLEDLFQRDNKNKPAQARSFFIYGAQPRIISFTGPSWLTYFIGHMLGYLSVYRPLFCRVFRL